MENFFGLMKSELLYTKDFKSMEEFKGELEEYIDWYNNKRIKTKLKTIPSSLFRVFVTLVLNV